MEKEFKFVVGLSGQEDREPLAMSVPGTGWEGAHRSVNRHAPEILCCN